MKAKILTLFFALAAVMSSCTKLNSGDSFNQTVGGIEYNFEVIVSKIAYVRLTPVSAPSVVKGDITLPTTAVYDGVTYTVTQIGQRAFRDYTGITSVTLPKTLSQIENEAFAGCTSLQAINTPQPLSVIGAYAFDGCSQLKAFSLEASLSELGKGAFRGCASLEELVFTPTITEIPDELCSGCTSLKEINLPSTIMHVGTSAFEGCTSARAIKIDRSLQNIGARAFSGCIAVGSISCTTATPPVCSANTFDGIPTDIPVTVPMANVGDYRNATGWNRFSNYTGKY
ncbi:MAG: leucine-rich repeat domain-containing protein [Bacteroidales bacterium]|nr:leucine-rich repeat domain-containing protein [Bacteroidales bacterium]